MKPAYGIDWLLRQTISHLLIRHAKHNPLTPEQITDILTKEYMFETTVEQVQNELMSVQKFRECSGGWKNG